MPRSSMMSKGTLASFPSRALTPPSIVAVSDVFQGGREPRGSPAGGHYPSHQEGAPTHRLPIEIIYVRNIP